MRPENPLHELPLEMDPVRAGVFDRHLHRSWVATVQQIPMWHLGRREWGEETPLITLLGCRPDLDDLGFRLNSRDFATLDCDSDPCFRATLTLAVPRLDLHRSMRLTVTGLCVEGFRVDHASYVDSGPSTWLIPEGKPTAVRVELFRHPLVLPYTEDDDGWPDDAIELWRGIG